MESRTRGASAARSRPRRRSGTIDGFVHPDFDGVARVFRRHLRVTTGGAAVAVYHRGEPVLDVWGGRRTDEGDAWERDTVAMCFSTTKGVASAALHLLADRGLIEYEAPVATYWPEFAQGGKESVLVRHVLTHSSGLHRLRSIIDQADRMLDWDHMVDALARAEPAYEPGTRAGYHALTYGWLVGEIVRRVSGRPIGRFVAEELAAPLGADGLYVGLPADQRDREAPLGTFGVPRVPNRRLHAIEKRIGEAFAKAASFVRAPINPRRMINALAPRGIEDTLWGNGVLDAEIPAANGFFTARSLAKLYAAYAGGGEVEGVRLWSPGTVEQVSEVQHRMRDLVLILPMDWRLGYHKVFSTCGTVTGAFGHFGFGGSGAWASPDDELSLGFVCNRGAGSPIGDFRILELGAAAVGAARRREPARPSLPRSGLTRHPRHEGGLRHVTRGSLGAHRPDPPAPRRPSRE